MPNINEWKWPITDNPILLILYTNLIDDDYPNNNPDYLEYYHTHICRSIKLLITLHFCFRFLFDKFLKWNKALKYQMLIQNQQRCYHVLRAFLVQNIWLRNYANYNWYVYQRWLTCFCHKKEIVIKDTPQFICILVIPCEN